jgi:hypothetical protein
MLFSLLILSVILVSSLEDSFSDDIIATSIGFEDSTILELKNSRGNTANIDSVRIWLDSENEFKSFKTEQGWLGKKQLNGVIEFTSQKEVNPGESVKFGIKTIKQNPIINWKAIDSDGEIITSASAKITISHIDDDKPELNKPENQAIKQNSIFRLIPEQPSSDSDFRLVGENFIPEQDLDFYIQDEFVRTVKIDSDGKILFTSKIPSTLKNDRTEFILQDLAGNEKMLSLRILETENREITDIVKLSIGNTPKDVKLGDVITLSGMATPNSTITIISKQDSGDILNIETVQVGSNGKWTFDNLFSPDLRIGNISIEVNDGMSKILRNFNLISPNLINVFTEQTMYQPGDTIIFSGTGVPNQELSIILEDSVGSQIFSRSLTVGDSGNISFEINISRDSVEGTYILYLYQGNNDGITTFGVGQEPGAILILKALQLNFPVDEDVEILIQGVPNGQVALILIDSANREILSDSINLGPDGRELYQISSGELSNGSYTLSAQRGESVDEAKFSVGFSTGSGIITVQTTKSDYKQGEPILVLGNTATPNVLLELKITNPNGEVIKKIDTFSDQSGVFKLDNFRIPIDGKIGIWKIDVKSGSNFDNIEFEVKGIDTKINIILEKNTYSPGEIMNIQGSGATGSVIQLKIFNSDGEMISELSFMSKNNGDYSSIWQVPNDIQAGEYEILIDDGTQNNSIIFTIT